jgi:hypothetical protein
MPDPRQKTRKLKTPLPNAYTKGRGVSHAVPPFFALFRAFTRYGIIFDTRSIITALNRPGLLSANFSLQFGDHVQYHLSGGTLTLSPLSERMFRYLLFPFITVVILL